MVRKIFLKYRNNKNKIKPKGRKRKIFATIVLALSLLFGKSRLSSSQSPSSNFDNQTIQERVINDRDVIEDNDQQVILAKAEGNPVTPPTNRGPSNFPTPPSGSRPSRPVYLPKYRTAPKVVDQGLGAGANPAGAGGGGGNAKFDDDQCPVPKKQQSEESESFTYDDYRYQKKKKQSSENQCPIDEQNKAGIDELPDSLKYRYEIEGKAAKQELQRVWKDPETKKETLSKLKKINNGELTPRNQKSLTGFKKLKEYKFNKIRIIVNPGQKGGPDTIVAIVKRSRLNNLMKTFKNKFD